MDGPLEIAFFPQSVRGSGCEDGDDGEEGEKPMPAVLSCLQLVLAERREGGIGPHEALKINVLLAKENLAGSTLSHSFVGESG